MAQQSHTGKIKFYNASKGFGFIVDNQDSKEYFVHASGIIAQDELRENDEVVFDLKEGKKGLQCHNVDFK